MDPSQDVVLRISPAQARITVEQETGGVVARKEISADSLISCIHSSVETEQFVSPLLPPHCLAVGLGRSENYVLWYPHLRADITLYDTPYPDFPLPRLVFGFALSSDGRPGKCRIGVIKDEAPTPETPMYHYPFSNVGSGGWLCTGSNELPRYQLHHKCVNLPGFLLRLPNNMDSYRREHNKLGLEYRDLLEHLKDKDPSYYYGSVLVPNGRTLAHFIQDCKN